MRAGSIVVCDHDLHQIQIFRADGSYVSSFGKEGTQKGDFMNPRDVATTADGNILVCDKSNHRCEQACVRACEKACVRACLFVCVVSIHLQQEGMHRTVLDNPKSQRRLALWRFHGSWHYVVIIPLGAVAISQLIVLCRDNPAWHCGDFTALLLCRDNPISPRRLALWRYHGS